MEWGLCDEDIYVQPIGTITSLNGLMSAATDAREARCSRGAADFGRGPKLAAAAEEEGDSSDSDDTPAERAHKGEPTEPAGGPAASGEQPIDSKVPEPPSDDDTLLAHLLVVARLKPGERLTIKPLGIDQGGISSAMLRWWNMEGRAVTTQYLRALLGAAVTRLAEICSGKNCEGMSGEVRTEFAERFRANIRGTFEGLSALANTYARDALTVSSLMTLRDGTEARLKGVK